MISDTYTFSITCQRDSTIAADIGFLAQVAPFIPRGYRAKLFAEIFSIPLSEATARIHLASSSARPEAKIADVKYVRLQELRESIASLREQLREQKSKQRQHTVGIRRKAEKRVHQQLQEQLQSAAPSILTVVTTDADYRLVLF